MRQEAGTRFPREEYSLKFARKRSTTPPVHVAKFNRTKASFEKAFKMPSIARLQPRKTRQPPSKAVCSCQPMKSHQRTTKQCFWGWVHTYVRANKHVRWLVARSLTGPYEGFPLEPRRTGSGRPSPSTPPPAAAAHRHHPFPEEADVNAHLVAHFVGDLDQTSNAQHLEFHRARAHEHGRTGTVNGDQNGDQRQSSEKKKERRACAEYGTRVLTILASRYVNERAWPPAAVER